MQLDWIVGVLLAVLGMWLLRQSKAGAVPQSPVDSLDLAFDSKGRRLVVVALASASISTLLFLVVGETWSLANVVTVYGGLFGVCAIIDSYLGSSR